MNRGKIDVGKIRGWAEVKGVGPRWWASCPHCPTKIGFAAVYTHGDAMNWVDNHLFKYHAKDSFLFRVGGFGYPNKGEVRNDGR